MDYNDLTDQDVVVLACKGRESAYRELIRRYERPVLSVIYRMVRNRQESEDLAQDTFIKVLGAIDRYDPSYKFSSWIFKIAHNTALDHLRKKRPETHSLDGSPHAVTEEQAEATSIAAVSSDETPEEYVESKQIGEEIERALGQVRPDYALAIQLWHVEGRPYEEISEIMDIPLGTVKTYIHRGRKELREHLAHLRC